MNELNVSIEKVQLPDGRWSLRVCAYTREGDDLSSEKILSKFEQTFEQEPMLQHVDWS